MDSAAGIRTSDSGAEPAVALNKPFTPSARRRFAPLIERSEPAIRIAFGFSKRRSILSRQLHDETC